MDAYRVRLFILLMSILQSQDVSQLFEWIAAHIQEKVNLAAPGVACDFDLHASYGSIRLKHVNINAQDPAQLSPADSLIFMYNSEQILHSNVFISLTVLLARCSATQH